MTAEAGALACGAVSLAAVGVGLGGLLGRYAGWSDRPGLALSVGLGASPAIIGLAAYPLIASGLSGVTLAIIPAILGCALLLASRQPVGAAAADAVRPLLALGPVMVAVTLLLVGAIAAQTLTLAILESDALDFIMVGRVIARDGGLLHYPFVTPDPATGLYAPSIHPPAFPLLIAWASLAAPEAGLLLLRLACLQAFVAIVLIAAHMGEETKPGAGAFAALLVAASPMLVAMTASLNSDAMRIAAFMSAIAAAMVAADRPGRARAMAAGFLGAVAMWSHSAGVMVPAFAFLGMMLVRGRPVAGRLHAAVTTCIVSVLGGGGWYAANWIQRGEPITDSWPAAELPALGYASDMLVRRGLDGLGGTLLNGALQAFTNPSLMGAGFCLAAVATPLFLRERRNHAAALAIACFVAFMALKIAAALAGWSTPIKNIRYVMTIAPLAAVLGGAALAIWAARSLGAKRAAIGFACLCAGWSGATIYVRGSGLSALAPLRGAPESWALDRDRFAGAPLIRRLNGEPPGRVLTFRQPDMAYLAGRAWIDHFSPELLDIHAGSAADAAMRVLALGAAYAYVPASTPVTITRSALGAMLGDPGLAEPMGWHRGVRLFRLTPGRSQASCKRPADPIVTSVVRPAGPGDVLAAATRLPQLARLWEPAAVSSGARLPHRLGDTGLGRSTLRLELPESHQGGFALSLSLSGGDMFEIAAEVVDGNGRASLITLLDGAAPPTPARLSAQWTTMPDGRLTAFVVTRPMWRSGAVRIEDVDICLLDATR